MPGEGWHESVGKSRLTFGWGALVRKFLGRGWDRVRDGFCFLSMKLREMRVFLFQYSFLFGYSRLDYYLDEGMAFEMFSILWEI